MILEGLKIVAVLLLIALAGLFFLLAGLVAKGFDAAGIQLTGPWLVYVAGASWCVASAWVYYRLWRIENKVVRWRSLIAYLAANALGMAGYFQWFFKMKMF